MTNKIIVYGKHSVASILNNADRIIHKIYAIKSNYQLVANRPEVEFLDEKELEKKLQKTGCHKALHQGIFAIVERLKQPTFETLLKRNIKFLLLLDEMQDSHNLGAIVRSANLFEVDAIITTQNNSPDENPQLLKVASGAFEQLPFVKVVNLTTAIEKLQKSGFWVVGLSCKGNQNLRAVVQNFTKLEKIALVIGNEERGIRPRVENACDFLAKIAIAQKEGLDSLNASNAAAIALYEIHSSII